MASNAQVKELLELSEACLRTTIDTVVANSDQGKINFVAGRAELERTLIILRQFKQLPVGLLPEHIIGQIIASLQPLNASLEQMRDFSSEQHDPLAARDQLAAQYHEQALAFFAAALLYNCLPCFLEGRRADRHRCPSCILDD